MYLTKSGQTGNGPSNSLVEQLTYRAMDLVTHWQNLTYQQYSRVAMEIVTTW